VEIFYNYDCDIDQSILLSPQIRACIKKRVDLIILDNHNARISMYEDHIQYAVKHGYRFRIIEFVATEELIDQYRNRSYKKFPREVFVKLLKLWEKDPRAELVNPAFDEGNGDHHDSNNYNHPTNHPNNNNSINSDNLVSHKDKEKLESNVTEKERNLESQKESKKTKPMVRVPVDLTGNEGSDIDPGMRNATHNNNASEYTQWDTELLNSH